MGKIIARDYRFALRLTDPFLIGKPTNFRISILLRLSNPDSIMVATNFRNTVLVRVPNPGIDRNC